MPLRRVVGLESFAAFGVKWLLVSGLAGKPWVGIERSAVALRGHIALPLLVFAFHR